MALGKIKEKNKTNKKPKKRATGAAKKAAAAAKAREWPAVKSRACPTSSFRYTHKLNKRTQPFSLTLGLVT